MCEFFLSADPPFNIFSKFDIQRSHGEAPTAVFYSLPDVPVTGLFILH